MCSSDPEGVNTQFFTMTLNKLLIWNFRRNTLDIQMILKLLQDVNAIF